MSNKYNRYAMNFWVDPDYDPDAVCPTPLEWVEIVWTKSHEDAVLICEEKVTLYQHMFAHTRDGVVCGDVTQITKKERPS